MTEPTTQTTDELARAKAAARSMNEEQLVELHHQGRGAFAPGAWEVLDDELRHRWRNRKRPPGLDVSDDGDRYPALRIIVLLNKLIAALIGIATVVVAVASVLQARENKGPGLLAGVLVLIVGAIVAITYWAGAELLVLLMDIEENTRATRRE